MTTANHRLKGTIRQTVFPEWSIRSRPVPRVTAAPGLTAESVETQPKDAGSRTPFGLGQKRGDRNSALLEKVPFQRVIIPLPGGPRLLLPLRTLPPAARRPV